MTSIPDDRLHIPRTFGDPNSTTLCGGPAGLKCFPDEASFSYGKSCVWCSMVYDSRKLAIEGRAILAERAARDGISLDDARRVLLSRVAASAAFVVGDKLPGLQGETASILAELDRSIVSDHFAYTNVEPFIAFIDKVMAARAAQSKKPPDR